MNDGFSRCTETLKSDAEKQITSINLDNLILTKVVVER